MVMEVNQHSGPGPPIQKVPSSDRLVTGPSCLALKTAVSALYSVDDFTKTKIGAGLFSEVYKVTHKTTGQVMVLKMNQLRSNRTNMLREVQLLNKLSHPNILSFMGVCVHEGQLHALTEYINGGSLEQLLANEAEPLSPAMKVRLSRGIGTGMAYLHESGIFHRDLTSKNVLIRKLSEGVMDAVVGDFGLAAKIPRKCKTRLDTVGSPYWMSPECLKGQWYDQRSDVFSFGIILCEIIARIEADPDILPRTDSFGLDYLQFVELCPNDTPPIFLRLAFYCCTYDPKSRPTFNEIVKKLGLLADKLSETSHQPAGPVQMMPQPPAFLLAQSNAKSSPIGLTQLSHNATPPSIISASLNGLGKTPAPPPTSPAILNGSPDAYGELLGRNGSSADSSEDDDSPSVRLRPTDHHRHRGPPTMLNHRRSMSENVIMFPPHTTPSDKARCHMLNRTNNGHTNRGSITEEQTSGSSSSTCISEYPPHMPANVSLRKVAETMFLKDPQYKPRLGDAPASKSNPFTTLAQLRGVKKILGANPSTYTAGVGDLFSSCFEMSSPFLRQLSIFQKANAKGGLGTDTMPKSLPSSPTSVRRDFSAKMSSEREDSTLKTIATAKNVLVDGFVKVNGATEMDSCTDAVTNHPAGQDADAMRTSVTSGAMKKFKANSLYSHPLFKSGGNVEDVFGAHPMDAPIEYTQQNTRRGSSESGFFSCLNEDFATPRGCNCLDRYRTPLDNTPDSRLMMCRCCLYTNTSDPSPFPDTASALMLDEGVNSLRSLDADLDLVESTPGRMGRHLDLDARSVDVDLINRLALDSEINGLMQKNQFTNQLLYCKNRTSSIYTDSSDDISSLAGSDSLLWDDRTYTAFPNARSAQIAKIVEYFERKGQSFKPFQMPESFRSSSSSASSTASYRHSSPFSDCFHSHSDFRSEYPFGGSASGGRKLADYKSRLGTGSTGSTAAEYEAFCLELDKRPVQQRIMVCEGAVKSKLQIFDKLTIRQAGSGGSAYAAQRE